MDIKTCPVGKLGICGKDYCQWWDGDGGRCAVWSAAESLRDINENLLGIFETLEKIAEKMK